MTLLQAMTDFQNLKKQNNLKSYQLSGEIEMIKSADIEKDKLQLRDKLKKYDKKDIYNFDETGLFFVTHLILWS